MNGNKKTIRSSGRRYPMFDLEDAVKMIEIVDKKGGGKLDSDILAQEMNYKTSTIRHHVRSAKYFGLIEQDGNISANTELAKSICMPISNEEQIQSIQNAFLSCELYSCLIDRFKGARVPEEPTLSNIIHREFEVSATGKDVLAKNFVASLKFAGLAKERDDELIIPLNGGNVIARTDETFEVPQKAEEQKSPVSEEEKVASVGNQENQGYNLPLPLSRGRTANLIVPGMLSKKEADKLKKLIDLLVEGD